MYVILFNILKFVVTLLYFVSYSLSSEVYMVTFIRISYPFILFISMNLPDNLWHFSVLALKGIILVLFYFIFPPPEGNGPCVLLWIIVEVFYNIYASSRYNMMGISCVTL